MKMNKTAFNTRHFCYSDEAQPLSDDEEETLDPVETIRLQQLAEQPWLPGHETLGRITPAKG